MNEISIKMTVDQVAVILSLLKPYTELSMSLTNQYKVQLVASQMPVRAKKVEENIEGVNNASN